MLIVKVLDWARASGGLFPVACQPGTYARAADMGPDAMSQIKWARVKTLQRSLEKILRSYREVCPFPPAFPSRYSFPFGCPALFFSVFLNRNLVGTSPVRCCK